MTKEKIIEILEGAKDWNGDVPFEVAVKAISKMAENIPQWIPCSERLPKEDGTYLVYAPCYTGGSSSAKEWHDGVMFSKIKNGKWSVEHGYYKRPGCVVAWMPLPEPYQAERREDD